MLILPLLAAPPDDARRAFIESLWEKYRRYMFYTARGYTGDPAALEDIVSESLLRLMGRADTLKRLDEPQLVVYIRRTVRSRAVDYLRRARRDAGFPDGPDDIAADADWRRVELAEELEALLDAVDGLPEPERRAVRLRYGERESNAGVAAKLGVAESTVRRYLKAARCALKRALYEDRGMDDGD